MDQLPLLWITDIHSDKKNEKENLQMMQSLACHKAKALLITGDIGENKQSRDFLLELKDSVACPIYFVLGNHDYYQDSIDSVAKKTTAFSGENEGLIYLPSKEYVLLEEDIALVGIDNWHLLSDSFFSSTLMYPDYENIEDFHGLNKPQLVAYFEQKTKQSCSELERKLEAAFQKASHVILLMHIPPFDTTTFYDGKKELSEWEPYTSNTRIGEFLIRLMESFPGKSLQILSGHTHNAASYAHEKGQITASIGSSSDHNLQLMQVPLFEKSKKD